MHSYRVFLRPIFFLYCYSFKFIIIFLAYVKMYDICDMCFRLFKLSDISIANKNVQNKTRETQTTYAMVNIKINEEKFTNVVCSRHKCILYLAYIM